MVRTGNDILDAGSFSREYFNNRSTQVATQSAASRNYVSCKLNDQIIQLIREKWTMPKRVPVEKEGMVWIPPGPFICGEGKEARVKNLEKGFWMDKYPVTNQQFATFLDSGAKIDRKWFKDEKRIRDKKFAQHPVVEISWHGAQAYAAWQKKQLPTDDHWEKAARGVDGRTYPWGDEFGTNLCNTRESGKGTTTPVDAYPGGISPYGCLDMVGNVWEWMENPYTAGSQNKCLRGGAWDDDSDYARCAVRLSDRPVDRNDFIGFRCSRTSP